MAQPFYHNVTVSLHIVYDGHLYFYNRRENGRIVVDAKPISRERAADIMRLNEDDPAVKVSKRGTESGFSWMADVTVQVEDRAHA